MFIVVLPYTETSRLFHASKSTEQEAFIGSNGIVYYQSQARQMDEAEAIEIAASHDNKKAFVREVK